MAYWLTFSLILIMGVAALAGLLAAARRRWPEPGSRARERAQGLALALFSLFLTLMALEFFFKVFFARPDDFSHSLAFRNWRARYWGQTNSLGHRDR